MLKQVLHDERKNSYLRPQRLGDGENILVAAAAQVGENDLVAVHLHRFARHRRRSLRGGIDLALPPTWKGVPDCSALACVYPVRWRDIWSLDLES